MELASVTYSIIIQTDPDPIYFQPNPIFKRNNLGKDKGNDSVEGYCNNAKKKLFALRKNHQKKTVKTLFLIQPEKTLTLTEVKRERSLILRMLKKRGIDYHIELEINSSNLIHFHGLSTKTRKEVKKAFSDIKKLYKRWKFKITTQKRLDKFRSIEGFFPYFFKAKVARGSNKDIYSKKRCIFKTKLGLRKSYHFNFWEKSVNEYWQDAINFRKNESKAKNSQENEGKENPLFLWPVEYDIEEETKEETLAIVSDALESPIKAFQPERGIRIPQIFQWLYKGLWKAFDTS